MEYLLILVLQFSVGDTTPLIIIGDKYGSIQECQEQGIKTGNWLTQDFVKAEIYCMPQNTKVSGWYLTRSRSSFSVPTRS